MRLTKRVAVITGAASRHRQRSLAKPMSESGPKQEVVVRQVRGDMRTFARAFRGKADLIPYFPNAGNGDRRVPV